MIQWHLNSLILVKLTYNSTIEQLAYNSTMENLAALANLACTSNQDHPNHPNLYRTFLLLKTKSLYLITSYSHHRTYLQMDQLILLFVVWQLSFFQSHQKELQRDHLTFFMVQLLLFTSILLLIMVHFSLPSMVRQHHNILHLNQKKVKISLQLLLFFFLAFLYKQEHPTVDHIKVAIKVVALLNE